MSSTADAAERPARHAPPSWTGWATVWGLLSAVGYTLSNICLRSVADADPFLVTTIKTTPTILLAAPWLWQIRHKQSLLPAGAGLGWLVAAAALGQLGGNVAFQWSLHLIGMALAVPLMMGCLVFSGALLGQRMLGERAGGMNLIAMGVLAGAIAMLASGADEAGRGMAAEFGHLATGRSTHRWQLLLAVAAAALAGLSYALLGVALRHCLSRGVPAPTSLLIVSLVGLVGVGAIAWRRMGWQSMSETPAVDLQQMLMAGVWNAFAFVALMKSLEVSPLFYTNALNASQIAMASLAGVWFFNETSTNDLVIGVVLTAIGLLLIRRE